jgi:hypothetical protein
MGHILRAAKKGAHVTHSVLQKVSPVYAKATRDHENRKKLRQQKKIGRREQDYHRGRHQ